MVVPSEGLIKRKLRRCIRAGSVPAMAAAACVLPTGRAEADLMFLPSLNQVIDLDLVTSGSVSFIFDMDNDPLAPLQPEGGGLISPLVGLVELVNYNGMYHFAGNDALQSYSVGSLVDNLSVSISSQNVSFGTLAGGQFIGIQFPNADDTGTHYGFFKMEYDAGQNTITLSNFAYETVLDAPAVISYIPGDLDGDGFVGISDLNTVLSNWNMTVFAGDIFSGDPSGDGFVGIDDLNTVLGNWNNGIPPVAGAAVPEPAALAAMGLGALGYVSRRRARGE